MIKYYISILTFLFVFQVSFGQSTWDTKVPNGNLSDPIKLMKTNDGGFLLISLNVEDPNFQKLSQGMVKFDEDGQVLWEKQYDFGATDFINSGGVYPSGAIELNNGDILSTGRYFDIDTSYFYLLKTNSNGDSLLMKNYGDYSFGGLQYVGNEIYAGHTDSSDIKYLLKIDEDGNVLSQIELGDFSVWNIVIDDDLNVFTSRGINNTIFKKFSINGDFIQENSYTDVGQYLKVGTNGYPVAYSKGMIQLNLDLTERWYKTPDELLISPNASSIVQVARVLLPTTDNGYILAGSVGPDFDPAEHVYIIKLDADGNWEWGYDYSSFYLPYNGAYHMVEVNDGYVFIGRKLVLDEVWLVKLNKDGLVRTTSPFVDELNVTIVSISPNPTSDFLNIQFSSLSSGIIQISNLQGKIVIQQKILDSKNIELFVSNLSNGVYFLSFIDERSNQIINKEFVKI